MYSQWIWPSLTPQARALRVGALSSSQEVSRRCGDKDERLGFLSEGAFFGEAPILGMSESGMELRMRTVRAVTDSELCFLTKGDVGHLLGDYTELRARLKRFSTTGMVVNAKRMRQVRRSSAHTGPD